MSRTPPRASSRSRPASPKSPFGGAANLADRFANVSLASTDGGGAGAAKGAYAAPDTSVHPLLELLLLRQGQAC